MSDIELKHCPFCGSAAVILKTEDSSRYIVMCGDGFCPEKPRVEADSLEGGCLLWNIRPIEDALKDENTRLRKALENIKNELEMFQDKVYDFHFDIDSKSAAYMLDTVKIALGEDNDGSKE